MLQNLDSPVYVLGSENLPAIPLNTILEKTMLPNTEKVSQKLKNPKLLNTIDYLLTI